MNKTYWQAELIEAALTINGQRIFATANKTTAKSRTGQESRKRYKVLYRKFFITKLGVC
jgi:hypothetical protein